jgi:hypothetical protein
MDLQDVDYPFASPLAYDRFGVKTWNNSLRLDTDQGLMNNFLTDWIDFINSSQNVKMDFALTLKQLHNIMKMFLPQEGIQYHKIHVQNIEYIPKKFSIMLSMNGIDSCNADLVKKGTIVI